MRALRQLGFDASRLGEPYRSEDDGRQYAVLHMPAMRVGPSDGGGVAVRARRHRARRGAAAATYGPIQLYSFRPRRHPG